MRLGLGTGSTAKHFVDLLGQRVRSGLDVICVPGGARQAALIDMRLNLGPARLRGFRNMIAAAERQDWATAALEARDSAWAKQVQPTRVEHIVTMFVTGEWPT